MEQKTTQKKNEKIHMPTWYNTTFPIIRPKMHKKLVKHITAKYVQLLQQKNQT